MKKHALLKSSGGRLSVEDNHSPIIVRESDSVFRSENVWTLFLAVVLTVLFGLLASGAFAARAGCPCSRGSSNGCGTNPCYCTVYPFAVTNPAIQLVTWHPGAAYVEINGVVDPSGDGDSGGPTVFATPCGWWSVQGGGEGYSPNDFHWMTVYYCCGTSNDRSAGWGPGDYQGESEWEVNASTFSYQSWPMGTACVCSAEGLSCCATVAQVTVQWAFTGFSSTNGSQFLNCGLLNGTMTLNTNGDYSDCMYGVLTNHWFQGGVTNEADILITLCAEGCDTTYGAGVQLEFDGGTGPDAGFGWGGTPTSGVCVACMNGANLSNSLDTTFGEHLTVSFINQNQACQPGN